MLLKTFVQLILIAGTTTTGANILKALLQCLEGSDLNLSKVVSITTDVEPHQWLEKNKGVMSLLQKHRANHGINKQPCEITVSHLLGSIVNNVLKLKGSYCCNLSGGVVLIA